MITMPDAPTGSARAFRIAVVASLMVHLLAIVLALIVGEELRTPASLARKRPDEIVTLSSAFRFEKRAKPAPAPHRRDGARIARSQHVVVPQPPIARETPVAPARYRLQMKGKSGSLHHGQGTYTPTKSWHAGNLDYYYVTYEYVYPDGTYEMGRVPWPIHFRPASDPFANDRLDLLARTPLPSPPTGYVPPGTLGKALRVYFPNLRFSDAN